MKQSAIGWADFSGGNLNFVSGCTAVSEGCANCYARAIYEQRLKRDFSKVTWNEDKLRRAVKAKYTWDIASPYARATYKRGEFTRPICFVCDTGDLFHQEVPTAFIFLAFLLMGKRPDVDWVILTKRPERLCDFQRSFETGALKATSNIWLGVTCETQARADERIPVLLANWAGPKFVSVEPMLEAITLDTRWLSKWTPSDSALSWIIVGAESGTKRRPFDPGWAKAIYYQCRAAGVPCFLKQDSGPRPGVPLLIDGKVIQQFPAERAFHE